MDLWQLNVFCKVIEYKSFSKAGHAVHLSQPTVSSHVKELESHFNCRLIDRLAKAAVPTKAGELLYAYARKLIALRDETESAIADFLGNISGDLVIGGSTIPGGYLLPPLIGAFKQRHPDVTVSLIIKDTEKIIADVRSGMLEVGIVGARTRSDSILQSPLIEDRLCLAVPPDHKWSAKKEATVALLAEEPFITRETGSGTLESLRLALARSGYSLEDLNVVARMGNTEAIRQAVKNHVGISIISLLAVAEDIDCGRLKALTIKELDLKRSFYLTRHKHRTLSPLSRLFIRFIRDELQTR